MLDQIKLVVFFLMRLHILVIQKVIFLKKNFIEKII